MPEDVIDKKEVRATLDNLEDHSLDNHVSRMQNYKTIQMVLDKDEQIDAEQIKRLLAVCVHDITTLKFTAVVLNTIPMILSKVKMGKYDPEPDLVPSALAVMNVIKTIALLSKVESLMALSYETLLSYPEDTLITVAEQHNEVMEVFNLYCHIRIPTHTRLQAFSFLYELLKILPPEKKKVFVEKGVSVWFSKIIPTVMVQLKVAEAETDIILEMLELLTDDLIHVDYTDNPQWHNILECICNTKEYPAMMKLHLLSKNKAWYRMWIIFIRLLKHQITQQLRGIGTPINSILPVVEAAFKLDAQRRCNAFECWNVLIDSFSNETNENNVAKRLKLLVIPLRSNNAKVKETALAKFKCWWHLMRKFQNRMDKYYDIILVSFLHFCFGKHNSTENSALVPGQFSTDLKTLCNQAIVDMFGHVNCNGCTDLPKLKGKVVNTKHLVDNWSQWAYSITSVIMKTVNSNNGLTKQQLTCLWKSFLMTIGELPENNVRKDLFTETLSITSHLVVKDFETNIQFLEIVFNVLILSFFDEDTKIKQLFMSANNDTNAPIITILKVIFNSSLYGFYRSITARELTTKLKTVANLIVHDRVCSPEFIISWVLTTLPANDFTLMMWDTLLVSLCEAENDKCILNTHDIWLWPLKSIHSFTEVKIPAMTWYTSYSILHPKLHENIEEQISGILLSLPNTPVSTVYFKLCAVLGILKHTFTNYTKCEKEINMLLNLTKTIESYDYFKEIFPVMVDTLVAIMNILTTNVVDSITALILVCVKNVLYVLIRACKQQSNNSSIMTLIGILLNPVGELFAVESYSKLIPSMTYHLLKCSPILLKYSSTQSIILTIMETVLSKTKVSDTNYSKIISLISSKGLENGTSDDSCGKNDFTAPQKKEVPKLIKKKEPNIVNTVVENGEQYVVVKSNWKFNPKKLTENQREKLQRKREDIPALYQDLSQSQDEFKLMAWKTDSQDTSSSSKTESKSNNTDIKETTIEILANLPSTDVVPKILENFLSEQEKKDSSPKDYQNITEVSTPATRNTKSPRMALKDRISRNVKILREKSDLQKENKDSTENLNKTDNNIKTPSHIKNINIAATVNSAPTLLSADRPSRMKRKPKKFEDLLLLSVKKSRHSSQDTTSEETQHQSARSTQNSNKDGKEIATILSVSENNENNANHLQDDDSVGYIIVSNGNSQNIDDKKGNETTQILGEKVLKDKEKLINNSEPAVMNVSDKREENLNEKTLNVKYQETAEVLVSKSTTDVKDVSISKLFVNAKDAPKDAEKNVSTNALDAISTPKAIKSVTEITSSDMPNSDKNDINPKTLKSVKEILTPCMSIDTKEVTSPKVLLTPKTLKHGKEVLTFNKVVQEVTTPNMLNSDKKDTNPKTLISVKEILTPCISKDTKEVTANTNKVVKQVAMHNVTKEISTHSVSKDVNEVVTPKTSTPLKEVTTHIFKDIKTTKPDKEMSSVNKDVSTPKVLEDGKNVSTSKSSKDSSVLDTPKASKDVKETLTVQTSADTEELTTPKTSKDLKVVSINITKDKNESTSKEAEIDKEVSTLQVSSKVDTQKSTAKKGTVRKSRIESELAIDMVEGHPYLKIQSEKRLTRKALEAAITGRRKSSVDKLNKSKFEGKNEKKTKEKNKESINTTSPSLVVNENHKKESGLEVESSYFGELPYSDDVIESSQDSTITTISVKSAKKTPKKVAVVCVQKLIPSINKLAELNNSQSILDCGADRISMSPSVNHNSKDDSILPLNETVLEENTQGDLTENMDTEPLNEQEISENVISLSGNLSIVLPVMSIVTEDIVEGPNTQEIAEADTQPTDPEELMDIDKTQDNIPDITVTVANSHVPETCSIENEVQDVDQSDERPNSIDTNNTVNNATVTLSESACVAIEQSSGVSSPFKDEVERQQDFLNNTIEISPIKTMSPDRNKKSPSPETSSDYVVIKFLSPVHSNGEPFEKCDSPEVFTEDKVSPDRRDQSPPRVEISVTSTSPSSSLSLKKNRPQVRSGGRAAQMLGLCVPHKVNAIVNPERNDFEEFKKNSTTNTPARRNLRILYNSGTDTESSNGSSENDDNENFLKFRKSLPAVSSSPSGPILKRKLAEITDDAMISPASKRKRVSFHDPPVSTVVSVQKYIEPGVLRSPQNSAQKRLERQLRHIVPLKSPKKLDNVFKLNTVLTTTVESFSDNNVIIVPDENDAFSLDETPVVEIVRASELNDIDPICPDLLNCKDPIENIAGELSSSAMKLLLIKELNGKVETVGDLAKMTELEVNRLCIKAPKVKVAKKVLSEYATKIAEKVQSETIVATAEVDIDEPIIESETKKIDTEVQTDRNESMEMEVQTTEISTRITFSQTDIVPTTHTSIQTEESGSKSTIDIIKSCISEKPDFIEELGKQLGESSLQQISEKLPLSVVTDILMKKITPSDTNAILNRILEERRDSVKDRSKELLFFRDYLCGKFDSKDLALLCSQILKIVYERPV